MMLRKHLKLFSINELIFILIAVFVTYVPSANGLTFDQHRIFELAIVFFTLLLALLSPWFRQSLISQLLCFSFISRGLLSALLLLAVGSVIFAPLYSYAVLETCLYAGLFLLSLTIASLTLQKTVFFQTSCFIVIILSSFFYQIAFFSGYLASFLENTPLEWPEPFSGFSNIRFFNQYHLWLFFLISLPILVYPNLEPRLRASIKIIATGWGILLFVSGSRGEVAAIFLALAICGVIFKKQAWPFIKLNSWILFSGLIGAFVLFTLIPRLLSSNVVASGWRPAEQFAVHSPRLYLWKLALDYMTNHPWLGVGPMHYAYYPNIIAAHPHNSLLQWGAEMGIPSLAIVIALLARGLKAWIKRFNAFDKSSPHYAAGQQLWIALFCTLSAELIYSMLDGVIVMPMSQILMATVVGWMLGFYFQSQAPIIISKKTHLLTMVLISMVLSGLTYALMPDLALRLKGLDPLPTRIHPERMQPRFWQQGQIPN